MLSVLLALACLLPGCTGQDAPPQIPEATVQQAARLATEFKAALMAALKEGLADGPQHAIGACSIRAPELAEELSVDGVRIGRTALRLRNLDNAPEPWLEQLLQEYVTAGTGGEPRSVRIDAASIGYVEPLYIGEPCLACHGERVSDAVSEQIAELYPDDRATGFKLGEFRGLLWVAIPG